MSDIRGQSRVIIENVQPQVDGGHYPAKFTIGEYVRVTADIFGDGHDHLRAQVLYKHETDESWSTLELKPQSNDNWAATFPVDRKGFYLFTIRAWVDHLETWYDGFRKKAEAAVDVARAGLEAFAERPGCVTVLFRCRQNRSTSPSRSPRRPDSTLSISAPNSQPNTKPSPPIGTVCTGRRIRRQDFSTAAWRRG